MSESVKSGVIWRSPCLLSSKNQPASIKEIRLSDVDHGVIDPKTYDAVEVDALFDVIDHTKTQIGHLTLFRSLARPITDAQVLQKKQASLQELESNPELYRDLKQYVGKLAVREKFLNHLLYGEFAGGLSTDDDPKGGSSKLEFNGCGYRQFKDGTDFAVELVEAANALPQPKTSYLGELIDTIRNFSQSRIYKLMYGPVYHTKGKFKTKEEKAGFLPIPQFQPSMFKLLPIFFFMAAVGGILYFFQTMLPELGASYIGYGILALTVPVFPVILHAIGVSDRDAIIYPLRKQFRQSPELAQAMDALGMIDELLSFRCYAESLGDTVTLPEIIENKHHQLIATKAKNPLLVKDNPDFVPNDITLDADGRILIITGPNSGGKTAFCKTVAQVQLLGQIGCYIPAAKAQLVPVEHLYYQVPDPGQLDAGIGRFGHELKRTREIFFNATPQSLVVLDELSEGTTFEEKMTLSEYILKGFHKLGASTLLVTHNHELCERLQSDSIGRYLQVEFVPQGPTHRLIAGVSRVSHADRVASEIGFSKEDVEKHLAARDRKKNSSASDAA
jgi:DNA mismatch repair protein MutS